MKPYYSDSLVTIYCGDNRDVLAQLPKADLMLTDPPYGIDLNCDNVRGLESKIQGRTYKQVANDSSVLDFSVYWSLAKYSVVFGANNWPQQIPFDNKTCGWICWDKRGSYVADKILGSPFELATVIGRRMYKMVRLVHCGVVNADGKSRSHPTEKPVALMAKILTWFPESCLILDPFMGTGATLIAAKALKCRSIGIELDERYCEIAVKRVRTGSFYKGPETREWEKLVP